MKTLAPLLLLSACAHTTDYCNAKYDEPKRPGSLVELTGGLEETYAETISADARYSSGVERNWHCTSELMLEFKIKQMLERMEARRITPDDVTPLPK